MTRARLSEGKRSCPATHFLDFWVGLVVKPFLSTFSQIGEEGIGIRSIIPEVARPSYDIMANRDWKDAPNRRIAAARPEIDVREKSTDDSWKAIAQFLNSASGGRNRKSGVFDFYPKDIREILNPYVGRPAKTISEFVETGKSIAAGERPDPNQVPVGRVFFGQNCDAADRALARQRQESVRHPWTQ